MDLDDSLDYLFRLEREFEDWDRKYKEAHDHRWFTSYVFMSEKMRNLIKLNITPILELLTEIKTRLGETFEPKDLSFHIDTAATYIENMKKEMKMIITMYSEQQDYAKIRNEWGIVIPQLLKHCRDLRGRLLIIKRITEK